MRSFILAFLVAGFCIALPARALSTFQHEDAVSTADGERTPAIGETTPDDGSGGGEIPIQDDVGADGADRPSSDLVRPDIGTDEPVPAILHDIGALPAPVRHMREMIIEACKSGDPERLRPLIGSGDSATQLSLSGLEQDPIRFLHEISGDEGGQEILAILLELMQMDYVRLNEGSPTEIYVWPYYFAVPLKRLTPPQRVQLFTLVTAGDYEDMKNFGAYNFYRVGITPEGHWLFFVAGD